MKMIINLLPFLYMDNMHLQSNNKILICLILFVLKEFVTACTPVVTKSSSTVLILIMMKHTKWTTSYLRKWNKETFEVLAVKQTGESVVWCKWIDGFNENEREENSLLGFIMPLELLVVKLIFKCSEVIKNSGITLNVNKSCFISLQLTDCSSHQLLSLLMCLRSIV